MRYLGIDFGTKKIGLALSDESGTMGFPRGILANTPKAIEEIAAMIERENVESIVIGDSRDFSGNANPVAAEAKKFAEELAAKTGLPIEWEQEFLTSAQARRDPGQPDAKPSRSPENNEAIDDKAAALILTNYLTRIA